MSTSPISACVPCFNNASTLATTLESIRRQTVGIDDIVVVDDGSSDGSTAVARVFGARVVQHDRNLGRGAARARAMAEARHPFVLSVDATAVLPAGFAAAMFHWFDDDRIAAVCGPIDDPRPEGVIRRWRARHLYRVNAAPQVSHGASLITTGSMLRVDAVLAVGNFDARLRHSEDAELGRRLLAAGFDVVFDPRSQVQSSTPNSLAQLLERYWRWNTSDEPLSWSGYARQVAYSLRVLVREDLAANDPASVPISLIAPHYQAWKNWNQPAPRA